MPNVIQEGVESPPTRQRRKALSGAQGARPGLARARRLRLPGRRMQSRLPKVEEGEETHVKRMLLYRTIWRFEY